MVVSNIEVKCFFCGKKLMQEEMAALALKYCPVCFECRKWLSGLKEEKFFKVLSAFLVLVFLYSISVVIC